jgi:uncharacterized membrane protein YedE/YeeE
LYAKLKTSIMNFIEWIRQPWPWYIAGPLIGLTVPALLILGNKSFGVSSTMRHICAACVPMNISFFKYDWKKEIWNLFFAGGILLGGLLTAYFLSNPNPVTIDPKLATDLASFGVTNTEGLVPKDLFSWENLFTVRGLILMVGGGFLVGFGTRYAGGCTSGHAIMGISNLQWPSLVATCCFMLGGFFFANIVLPLILKL